MTAYCKNREFNGESYTYGSVFLLVQLFIESFPLRFQQALNSITCIMTTKEVFKRTAFFGVYSFYFSERFDNSKNGKLNGFFGSVLPESESCSVYFSECFENKNECGRR